MPGASGEVRPEKSASTFLTVDSFEGRPLRKLGPARAIKMRVDLMKARVTASPLMEPKDTTALSL